MAYGDQACVSACPTGSLIEINAYELFRERSPAMAPLARTGFDARPAKKDRSEVLPVLPFTEGLGVRDGGLAKVKRGRYAPLLMWCSACCVFLSRSARSCCACTRRRGRSSTASSRRCPSSHGLDRSARSSSRSGTAPATELRSYCGLVGTGLMIIAAIYPIFRRIKLFRWMASNTMWFDFHMMAGTVGPMFIVLHSALKLDTWVSAAFWSMVIVVVSGVLGRYLYTQVPELLSGVELEELDHERAFQARAPALTRCRWPRSIASSPSSAPRRSAVATSPSLLRALWWLIFQDVGRTRGRSRGAAGSRSSASIARPASELARRAGRMIVIARRRVVAPKAQLLLHSWKKVHVPFTIMLTGIRDVPHLGWRGRVPGRLRVDVGSGRVRLRGSAVARLLALVLVLRRRARARVADDFFSTRRRARSTTSHGALDTRTTATTATSTARKDVSNDKCLGCHDHNDLRARINAGKGFHASAHGQGQACETCHVEHKGRGFDLMGWRRSTAARRASTTR